MYIGQRAHLSTESSYTSDNYTNECAKCYPVGTRLQAIYACGNYGIESVRYNVIQSTVKLTRNEPW